MATEEQIDRLKDLASDIRKVDKEKLLRPSLGEEALQKDFEPKLEEIYGKFEFALEHSLEVHDNHLHNVFQSLNQIKSEIESQANRSNVDYVGQRTSFLTNIDRYLDQLKEFWPPFVTAAVEKRGFLEDEGVRREYERSIESLKTESESALQQVQSEAQKTIAEARELAEQIENRARLTAARISVDEAQKQFHEAQRGLDRGVKTWAVIGGIFVVGFIGTALQFATADLPDQWRWEVIYFGAVRVSILAAIGTAAAFCLRILRAHLHMSEKNRHRQRVANSIGAFVESAVTPEQRDQILSQLVESVIQFGNSGLLQREDDNVYRPKLTIDSIMRTLTSSSGKQQS